MDTANKPGMNKEQQRYTKAQIPNLESLKFKQAL